MYDYMGVRSTKPGKTSGFTAGTRLCTIAPALETENDPDQTISMSRPSVKRPIPGSPVRPGSAYRRITFGRSTSLPDDDTGGVRTSQIGALSLTLPFG